MSERMTDEERTTKQSQIDELIAENKELESDLRLKRQERDAQIENARLTGEIAQLDSDDPEVIAELAARAALEAEGIRTT